MSTVDFDKFSTMRVDFHTHTKCSDGRLSPEELIERAINFQIDVLAITDHDTVDGLISAKRYILDKNIPLTLVDGIEISTSWQGFEIHVVGLNINPEHASLTSLITLQQQERERRAIAMGEKLTKCGFTDVLGQAKQLAGEGSITRAHFARVLFNNGDVSNMQAAFDKYIGKGKRAFVKPQWCDIPTAVKAIHDAGGVAVLAHPMRYDITAKWLRRLLVDFKEAQGDAMEIVLPQMNNDQRRLMLSYCLEYDLYASMGSDFHFPSKWSDLGRNLTMPEGCKPVWQLFN